MIEDKIEDLEKIEVLPIELIKIGLNIRTEIDDEQIENLAASIKKYGQLQPIRVYKEDEDYYIIFGHRRYYAVKKNEGSLINAIVIPKPDPTSIVYLQVAENEQNASLLPAEREMFIHSLIEKGESFQKISENIGKSESWVRECEAAYQIRKKYKGVIEKAGLKLGTKDLYAFRNATIEQVKEAIELSKKNPDKKKDILHKLNKLTKKKMNVGGKRNKNDEHNVASCKIVVDILIDEEEENFQINIRNNKKVDKVLLKSLHDVISQFFESVEYKTLSADSTQWNRQVENTEEKQKIDESLGEV